MTSTAVSGAPARRRPAEMLGAAGRVLRLDRERTRALVPLLAVVAVAAGVRIAWAVIVRAQPVSDGLFYYTGAQSIAAGHGYRILGHPTAFFPVGYPAFLAALFAVFGASAAVVRASGVALWTLSAGLAYLVGLRLGKGRAPALIGGLVVALYPDFIMMSGLTVSENLMAPMLLGLVLLLSSAPLRRISIKAALFAGALLGASILVRSTALLVPPVLAVAIVAAGRDRRRVAAAVALLAACALVVLPWVERNRLVMHADVLSTNGGYTLFLGLNPEASGGVGVRGLRHEWSIQSVRSEVTSNAELTRQSFHWLLHDPAQFVMLVPRKAYYLFRWTSDQLLANTYEQPGGVQQEKFDRPLRGTERELLRWLIGQSTPLAWIQYVYLVVAAAGLVLAVLRRLPAAVWAALLVGYWIVFHVTLIHGQARFLKSVTPLLAPFAAYAAVALVGLVLIALRRRSAEAATAPETAPGDTAGRWEP